MLDLLPRLLPLALLPRLLPLALLPDLLPRLLPLARAAGLLPRLLPLALADLLPRLLPLAFVADLLPRLLPLAFVADLLPRLLADTWVALSVAFSLVMTWVSASLLIMAVGASESSPPLMVLRLVLPGGRPTGRLLFLLPGGRPTGRLLVLLPLRAGVLDPAFALGAALVALRTAVLDPVFLAALLVLEPCAAGLGPGFARGLGAAVLEPDFLAGFAAARAFDADGVLVFLLLDILIYYSNKLFFISVHHSLPIFILLYIIMNIDMNKCAKCSEIPELLSQAVSKCNNQLIYDMIKHPIDATQVCHADSVTFDTYFNNLSKEWNSIICTHAKNSNNVQDFLEQVFKRALYTPVQTYELARDVIMGKYTGQELQEILEEITFEGVADNITANRSGGFKTHLDATTTLQSLITFLDQNCLSSIGELFKLVVGKYKKKYTQKTAGKTKNQIVDILRADYQKFKKMLIDTVVNRAVPGTEGTIISLAAKISDMYNMSIESELQKLIPDELGSMKEFFIKIIATYYENLHPIIWAQIFKACIDNIFLDLPDSPKDFFAFFSKQLILNSGPFILKIIQAVRPVLTQQQAVKYNLSKLVYPLMEPSQIKMVMRRCMYSPFDYVVAANYSASVGHVCRIRHMSGIRPDVMLKIIKPLAIAQSCWEYSVLRDVFAAASCEQKFVVNMLESTGREFDVRREIANIDRGFNAYNCDYSEIFGLTSGAKLTTIRNISGIVRADAWYAMPMTVAPGVPLSTLIENDMIKKHTPYRARLHRCADLLVYKFFNSIVSLGFYHGDLHSGNIFYSYVHDQITLIDFGAVGELDIYSDDPEIKIMVNIIVMSALYNYAGILNDLTDLLNKKCGGKPVDKTSRKYQELLIKLTDYQRRNISASKREKANQKKYQQKIFSQNMIDMECAHNSRENTKLEDYESIYSHMNSPALQDTIVENKQVLRDVHVEPTESISLTDVLEEILKFYALCNVNLAVKFNEFYEFQKAYALLLGVLHKIHYNQYRANIVIEKSIIGISKLHVLKHIGKSFGIVEFYTNQLELQNKFKKHYNL